MRYMFELLLSIHILADIGNFKFQVGHISDSEIGN